jgi:hypothetical protein
MIESHDGMVKIFFEPPGGDEDWHTKVESMWATPIDEPSAPSGQVFRLENTPWYAFGVSWQDLVCAESRREIIGDDTPGRPKQEVNILYFTRVWKHSGRSTYLAFLSEEVTTESPEWLKRWEPLERLGCTWEGMNARLLAVDVPPSIDLDAVEKTLEEGASNGVFDYQTQHRFSSS